MDSSLSASGEQSEAREASTTALTSIPVSVSGSVHGNVDGQSSSVHANSTARVQSGLSSLSSSESSALPAEDAAVTVTHESTVQRSESFISNGANGNVLTDSSASAVSPAPPATSPTSNPSMMHAANNTVLHVAESVDGSQALPTSSQLPPAADQIVSRSPHESVAKAGEVSGVPVEMAMSEGEHELNEAEQQEMLLRHQQAQFLARAGLMHPHAHHPYHAAVAAANQRHMIDANGGATGFAQQHHFAASHPYATAAFPAHQFMHFQGGQHLQHAHGHGAAALYPLHAADDGSASATAAYHAAAALASGDAKRHANIVYPAEMAAITGNFGAGNYGGAHMLDEHAAAAALHHQRYAHAVAAAIPQLHHPHAIPPHLQVRRRSIPSAASGDSVLLMGDGNVISSSANAHGHPHTHTHHGQMAHYDDAALAAYYYAQRDASMAAYQSQHLAALASSSSASAEKAKKQQKARKKEKKLNEKDQQKDSVKGEQNANDVDEESRRKAAKEKKKKAKEKLRVEKERKHADGSMLSSADSVVLAAAVDGVHESVMGVGVGPTVGADGVIRKAEKRRDKEKDDGKGKERKKVKEGKDMRKEKEKKERKNKDKPKALILPSQAMSLANTLPQDQLNALPSPSPELQSNGTLIEHEIGAHGQGQGHAHAEHSASRTSSGMDMEIDSRAVPSTSPTTDDAAKSEPEGAFGSHTDLTQLTESVSVKKGKKGRKPGSTNKRKAAQAQNHSVNAAHAPAAQPFYGDSGSYVASESAQISADASSVSLSARGFSLAAEGHRHTRQTHAAIVAETSESQQERLLHSVFRSLPTNPTRRSRHAHFQQNASAHKRKIVHFKMKAPEMTEEKVFVIKEAIRTRKERQNNGSAKNDALMQWCAERRLKEEKLQARRTKSESTSENGSGSVSADHSTLPVSSVLSSSSLSLLQLNMIHLCRMIELDKDKARVQQEAFDKERERQRKERHEENVRKQNSKKPPQGEEKIEANDLLEDEDTDVVKNAEEEKKAEPGIAKRRGRRRKAEVEEQAQAAKRMKTEDSDGKPKRNQEMKEDGDADVDTESKDEKSEDGMLVDDDGAESKESESISADAVAKHPQLVALEEKEKVMRQKLSEKQGAFKEIEDNLKKQMSAKQKLFAALKNILSSEALKKKNAPPSKDVKKPVNPATPAQNTANTNAPPSVTATPVATARPKLNLLKDDRPSISHQWMKPVFPAALRPDAAPAQPSVAASAPPTHPHIPQPQLSSPSAPSPQLAMHGPASSMSPSLAPSVLLSSPAQRQMDRRVAPSPAQSPGAFTHPLVRPLLGPHSQYSSMSASQLPPPPAGHHPIDRERERDRELDRPRERDAFGRFHPPPVSSPPQPQSGFQARPRMWSAPPPNAPSASPPQPPQMQSPHRPIPPMGRQTLGPSPSTPVSTTPGFSPMVAPLPSPVLNSSHGSHPPPHSSFADHRDRFDLESAPNGPGTARPPPPQPPLPPQTSNASYHAHLYRERDRPDTAPPLPPHAASVRPPPPPAGGNYGDRYSLQNPTSADFVRAPNNNFRSANIHPPAPLPSSITGSAAPPSSQSWHHSANYGSYTRNHPAGPGAPPASAPTYQPGMSSMQYDRDRSRYDKRFPADGPPMYPDARDRDPPYTPINLRERDGPPMMRDMRDRDMRPMHPPAMPSPPPSHSAFYRGPPPPHPAHSLPHHANRPPPPPPPPPHPLSQPPSYRTDSGNWH